MIIDYVGLKITHVTWNQRRWNRVLFSDESRFNVSFADGEQGYGGDQENGLRIAASWNGIHTVPEV